MGFDRKVLENYCQSPDAREGMGMHGHNITTQQVSAVWEPEVKMLVPEFSTFCIHCGASLEEIRGMDKKTRAKRAPKEAVPV